MASPLPTAASAARRAVAGLGAAVGAVGAPGRAGDEAGGTGTGAGAGATGGPGDADERSIREALAELASSARSAGRRAVVSGRWLADTLVELGPRIPVRDLDALSAHHGGLTGPALAKATTRAAGRVSGGIAAATGTLVAAQQLTVATIVFVPFELAAETALVTATELKLIAELHTIGGRPSGTGRLDASRAALMVWASGHALPAVPPGDRAGGPPDVGLGIGPGTRPPAAGVGSPAAGTAGEEGDGRVTLSRPARRALVEALRKRYARNLTTLAPMLTGAAAAGVLNRQATVGIGNAVARDLGVHR
jgi:hypothetical protein